MAKPRRILRLQQLILEQVAQTIQRELKDPRIGMVSITRVKLSPDLSRAQVYWSCLGDDSEHRKVQRGLEDAVPVIQGAVAQALQTRVTPRLQFHFDQSLEKAQRLEEIFQHLREERGEPDEESADELEEDEAREEPQA